MAPSGPIWEWTPEQFQEHRAQQAQAHKEWKHYKAFEKAVLQGNKKEILRLAPGMLDICGEPVDGMHPPPKTQPKNREEAMARVEWEDRRAARLAKAAGG